MSAVWLISAVSRILLAASVLVPAWTLRDCCCSRRAAETSGLQVASVDEVTLPPCCAKRVAAEKRSAGPQVETHHRCCCEQHQPPVNASLLARTTLSFAPACDAEFLSAAPLLWLPSADCSSAHILSLQRLQPSGRHSGADWCIESCRWNV